MPTDGTSLGGSFNRATNDNLLLARTDIEAADAHRIAAGVSEANALASKNAAAVSATNSANSATAGASSASTASTQASLATTNGAAQVTLATTQAGLATTNGQAQVTLATTQVTLATAQKTISVTKASEAASSATAGANSATAGANSATASANSATGAASSASTATTKASEASTSAGNAATSLATFTGQYVSQSSAPSSPGTGDLWFDTTNNIMKVYNSTNWVNAGSSVNGVQNSAQYIATANQTTFAATYDVTYLQVYLNGGLLAASDYTATNGTSVVLGVAAVLNDIVFIHSFGTFLLADHYSKVAADARYAQVATTTTANNALPKAGGAMTGAITTNSTFDGRDVATDGTKLDGIEANATADQTGAQIKTAYQAETNAFTDAQFTKLAGVATSANNYSHPSNHAISVITGLQSALDDKVDDTQVLTNVPSGAVFTDTVYSHPANHAISVITGLQTALNAKTTESYVDTEITNLIGGAPGALDTLNELAAAINDDASYAATITTALGGKAATSHNHNTLYDPIGASVAMAIALGG